MKQEIGIRELKNQTSNIVRQVREEAAEYVITYHGRPVAVLRPINDEDTAEIEREEAIEAWHKMLEIGRNLDESEPDAESALSILYAMRDEESQWPL